MALYLKTGYSLPGTGRHHLGGLAGLAPEPLTGIQRALGEATGSPWPPAPPSGRQWRRQVRALEREQHPAQPAQLSPRKFFLRAGTAGAVAGIAPGPRAPDQRSRAAQISSRVYGALVGRPADALPPATAPCSLLLCCSCYSVAQSSSRSLTAIAAHPLCRAVSSLEGGRGRPPEQCREREEKGGGCAMLMNVNVATMLAPPKISKLPPRPRMSRRP